MTPIAPEPAPLRPPRRVLFLHCLIDVLLFMLPMLLLAVAGIAIHIYSSGRELVDREDRWRVEAMPPNEDALLAWSKSQVDLRNFRVERVQGGHEIVLRYGRVRAKGPAQPDWYHLGYRRAYLVSAPSLEITIGTSPPLWLGLAVAFSAGGAVAVFRIRRGRRAGVPLILPTDRPQQGWLRWLLLALLMLAVLQVAHQLLLRILHVEQPAQDPMIQNLRLASGWGILMAAATVVLVGPVAEELLFRGCVFGRFQAYGYGITGAVISALLFSVAHGILALIPVYFGIGIILAWLCQRTRSLWPAMALHGLNNAVALIGVLWAKT